MTRRRNLVFELVLRRARHFQRIPRFEQTKRRLSDLGGPLGYLQRRAIIPLRHKRELYRYFPVAVVAIIEGHFKMLYSELIDSGEPFLSNARGFRDVKFDLDSLVGVRQRSVSIGELIANQLPHSSMSHIDSHMSTLLNQDFEASSKSDFAPRTRLPTTQPFKRTCADFWMSCFGSVTFTVTSLLRNRDRGFSTRRHL
jgi:hypothetical protein